MANQDDIRRTLIKRTRRDLLVTLKLYYPMAASFEDLRLVLPDVEEHFIKVDLAYLCDKGYVSAWKQQPNQKFDSRQYRLTALGVETADKINLDPAIEP